MASEEYEDDEYCEVCKKETRQYVHIHYSEAKRDPFKCWQRCLECGSVYSGMTGEWEKPRSKPNEDPND